MDCAALEDGAERDRQRKSVKEIVKQALVAIGVLILRLVTKYALLGRTVMVGGNAHANGAWLDIAAKQEPIRATVMSNVGRGPTVLVVRHAHAVCAQQDGLGVHLV